MAIQLKGRSHLTNLDFSPAELRFLMRYAQELRAQGRPGLTRDALKGKNIVLIYEKPSVRTRQSFQILAEEMGAHVTYLDPESSQLGKKESLADTARVLGRYYDAIQYRGTSHQVVVDLARYSGIPVWSGLTDIDHPTQALACLLTFEEHCGKPLQQAKFVNCGNPNGNMAMSNMILCAKLGVHYVSYSPKEMPIDPEMMAICQDIAKETGAILECTDDIAAIRGADSLYNDCWFAIAELPKVPERVRILTPYRITTELLAQTENPNCIIQHCQPSYHDFNTEVAKSHIEQGIDVRDTVDELYSSPRCKTDQETENAIFTKKAVMLATLA